MINKDYLKSKEWALIFENPEVSRKYNNVEYCNADFDKVHNVIVILLPIFSYKEGKRCLWKTKKVKGIYYKSAIETDKGFIIDSEKYGTIRMVEYSK